MANQIKVKVEILENKIEVVENKTDKNQRGNTNINSRNHPGNGLLQDLKERPAKVFLKEIIGWEEEEIDRSYG